jgi:hypothetical protein
VNADEIEVSKGMVLFRIVKDEGEILNVVLNYIQISRVSCDNPLFVLGTILFWMIPGCKFSTNILTNLESFLSVNSHTALVGNNMFLKTLPKSSPTFADAVPDISRRLTAVIISL